MSKLGVAAVILCTLFLTACGGTFDGQEGAQTATIADMTVNYSANPMNIDVTDAAPVFSWRMEEETGGRYQGGYRIVVSDSEENLKNNDYVWDSGRVDGDGSVAVAYEGKTLLSATKYYWRVYVWDEEGVMLEPSDISTFETGITDDGWDGARWIGLGDDGYDVTGKMITYPSQYTIEYDLKLNGKDCDSSFIWGADEGRYGNYYQCEIDTRNDGVVLRIGELYNGVYVNEAYAELACDKQLFNEGEHTVRIGLDGDKVTASVDGVEVLTTIFENMRSVGAIGLWTTRGAYYAYYDNIQISTPDGTIICQEDFNSDGDNIFSPYYVKTVDGWCEADSGFIMMTGWEKPAPMIRREFCVDASKEVASARLYASALGIYDIYINGVDVCDEYMAAGQSMYSYELNYRTYDITDCLNKGDNAIGVILGHGRYNRSNEYWGDSLAFIGKLVVNYSDGTSEVIVTDASWKTYDNGPIRDDDMYNGEYYDSNFELEGWSELGFDEADWKKAGIFEEYDNLNKIPATAQPVRAISEISPVSVSEPEEGIYVYDFGQNFNGNCVVSFEGTYVDKGDIVTMRYAEWLNGENLSCADDVQGTIYTENLYTAENTDYYVVSGKENEEYTPTFVYRGFRYVQITGVNDMIPIDNIKAYVITSDNERTGYFECSDEKINELYNAIYWTQLSNYVDIPTDCPQRDERLGWAGDAQVFAGTAAYNSNIYSFMDNYIDILRKGQGVNGAYPEIALQTNNWIAVNGWSDAGVILVWELYQQYGNTGIIDKNMEAMCRYVDSLVATSDNYIRAEENYSDHNAMSNIDADMADTAQCAYVSLLLSKMGSAVGDNDVATRYMQIYENYKAAWQNAYINSDGSIGNWLQSEYIFALAFGLYPDVLADKGAACLNTSITASDFHISTGYIATQFLLPILCDYGYNETAYKILKQDTFPSWNNMLSMGSTTITEGWNTIYDTGDGEYAINGSLNHMALGSVGQWIYEYMLGIKRDEDAPAFKHFYLEPVVDTELEYAKGSYKSMYGEIKSSWEIGENEIIYSFTIPANTTATVSLGADGYNNMELGAGTYEYRIPRS